MSSQGWGRRYEHHSGNSTSSSSQNASKVSQQKENVHVSNRVNVESGAYRTIPPITGGSSCESPVCVRRTSALSSESGDLSMLEESSRRTSTIHKEDKDDGRGSTFCPEHNKPVYFFCSTCDEPICATCREVKHKSHEVIRIDDNPVEVNHDNNQVDTEVQHSNPITPPKCPIHDRPCIMVCTIKMTYICKDCDRRYHCTGFLSDHVPLRSASTELLRKSEDFEWKMKSIESEMDKVTETGKSNIDTIMKETEALKMEINAATERTKERLEAYRNDMFAKIDKVAEEKINSCTIAVESLNTVRGFIQQARQMDMEFQRDAERGKYLKAMRSAQQIKDVIGNIDKTITQNNIKEDKLGLQMRQESFRDPFKVTRDGMWSSLF